MTTETIRSINYGQLATATDRLLVLGLPRKGELARRIARPVAPPLVRPRRKSASRKLPALGALIAISILLGFATTRIATGANPKLAASYAAIGK